MRMAVTFTLAHLTRSGKTWRGPSVSQEQWCARLDRKSKWWHQLYPERKFYRSNRREQCVRPSMPEHENASYHKVQPLLNSFQGV